MENSNIVSTVDDIEATERLNEYQNVEYCIPMATTTNADKNEEESAPQQFDLQFLENANPISTTINTLHEATTVNIQPATITTSTTSPQYMMMRPIRPNRSLHMYRPPFVGGMDATYRFPPPPPPPMDENEDNHTFVSTQRESAPDSPCETSSEEIGSNNLPTSSRTSTTVDTVVSPPVQTPFYSHDTLNMHSTGQNTRPVPMPATNMSGINPVNPHHIAMMHGMFGARAPYAYRPYNNPSGHPYSGPFYGFNELQDMRYGPMVPWSYGQQIRPFIERLDDSSNEGRYLSSLDSQDPNSNTGVATWDTSKSGTRAVVDSDKNVTSFVGAHVGKPKHWYPLGRTEWLSVVTDKGFTYFYNKTTGDATWQPPPQVPPEVLAEAQQLTPAVGRPLQPESSTDGVKNSRKAAGSNRSAELSDISGCIGAGVEDIQRQQTEDKDSNASDNEMLATSSESSAMSDDDLTESKKKVSETPVAEVLQTVGETTSNQPQRDEGVAQVEAVGLMPPTHVVVDFKQMLRDNHVASFLPYEKALANMVFDKRFLAVPKSMRRVLYDKFIKVVSVEQKEQEVKSKKDGLEMFRELLSELESNHRIHSCTTTQSLERKYSSDSRWCANLIDSKTRAALIQEIVDKKGKERQGKKLSRLEGFREMVSTALQRYIDNVREMNLPLDKPPNWSSFKQTLKDGKEYLLIGSATQREAEFYSVMRLFRIWNDSSGVHKGVSRNSSYGVGRRGVNNLESKLSGTNYKADRVSYNRREYGEGSRSDKHTPNSDKQLRASDITSTNRNYNYDTSASNATGDYNKKRGMGQDLPWQYKKRRLQIEEMSKQFHNLLAERIKTPFTTSFEDAISLLKMDSRFAKISCESYINDKYSRRDKQQDLPNSDAITRKEGHTSTTTQATATCSNDRRINTDKGMSVAEGPEAATSLQFESSPLLNEDTCREVYDRFVEDLITERVKLFRRVLAQRSSEVPLGVTFNEAMEKLELRDDKRFKGIQDALLQSAFNQWRSSQLDEAKEAFAAFLRTCVWLNSECEEVGQKFTDLCGKLSGDIRYQRLTEVSDERNAIIRSRIREVASIKQ